VLKGITYFNCKGKAEQRCKDMFYCRENGEEGFYSLADGVNSCAKSHIGARAVQKAIADLWEEQSEYFFMAPNSDIKPSLIETIKNVIYNLAMDEYEVEEYASTLLIVFISRKQGIYKWVHIGDGLIAKEMTSGEMKIESHPQNGITKQFTFTTVHKNLESYLRIGLGSLQDIKRFFVFTDGAVQSFYKDRKFTGNGEEFLQKGSELYYRVLNQLDIADDYSMIEVQV
jgi:hypothetical protein